VAALENGPQSVTGLAAHIYTGLVPEPFLPIAARQVLAHLNWLVAQDRVTQDEAEFSLKST